MKNESVWIFVINDKTRIIIYILSHIALYKHLYFKKEFRIPKSPNTKLPLLPFPNTFEEYNTTIKIRKIKSSDSPSHWFRFRPLENDSKARILASNYTVKVTKRTWDVCRRCTFAEEGGGPKGKKTEREREGEGRGRCTPQCGTTPDPIASSVSVLESSRSKRTSTDFGKRSLDNFLPSSFFPSGTNSRRYQEATKTSSNRIFRGYSQPKRKRIRDNRSKLHLLLLLFLLSFPLSREKIYFACKKLEMINRLNYIPCMGIERVHPFSKTVSPRTKRAVRSWDRAMYIYIHKERGLQRKRERKRGLVFEEISPLEANKYRPFRWPKVEVGRGSRSRDKGDGGQKRPGDRDRPEIWDGEG